MRGKKKRETRCRKAKREGGLQITRSISEGSVGLPQTAANEGRQIVLATTLSIWVRGPEKKTVNTAPNRQASTLQHLRYCWLRQTRGGERKEQKKRESQERETRMNGLKWAKLRKVRKEGGEREKRYGEPANGKKIGR